MDETNFHRTCLEDRAKILWEKGNFVGSITYFNYCLMLYSVDRQFVELFYDKNAHRIVWISLANEHDMMKYLNNIHLPV